MPQRLPEARFVSAHAVKNAVSNRAYRREKLIRIAEATSGSVSTFVGVPTSIGAPISVGVLTSVGALCKRARIEEHGFKPRLPARKVS